jgi:hypothetical protein
VIQNFHVPLHFENDKKFAAMKSKYKSYKMKTLVRVLAKQACKTKTLVRVLAKQACKTKTPVRVAVQQSKLHTLDLHKLRIVDLAALSSIPINAATTLQNNLKEYTQ